MPAVSCVDSKNQFASRLQTVKLSSTCFGLPCTVMSNCPVNSAAVTDCIPSSLLCNPCQYLGCYQYLVRGRGKRRNRVCKNKKPIVFAHHHKDAAVNTVTKFWTRTQVNHFAFNREEHPKPLILGRGIAMDGGHGTVIDHILQ